MPELSDYALDTATSGEFKRLVQDNDWYTPEMFDPDAGTGGDDTEAIQMAANAAAGQVEGYARRAGVYLQGKTYRISGPVFFPYVSCVGEPAGTLIYITEDDVRGFVYAGFWLQFRHIEIRYVNPQPLANVNAKNFSLGDSGDSAEFYGQEIACAYSQFQDLRMYNGNIGFFVPPNQVWFQNTTDQFYLQGSKNAFGFYGNGTGNIFGAIYINHDDGKSQVPFVLCNNEGVIGELNIERTWCQGPPCYFFICNGVKINTLHYEELYWDSHGSALNTSLLHAELSNIDIDLWTSYRINLSGRPAVNDDPNAPQYNANIGVKYFFHLYSRSRINVDKLFFTDTRNTYAPGGVNTANPMIYVENASASSSDADERWQAIRVRWLGLDAGAQPVHDTALYTSLGDGMLSPDDGKFVIDQWGELGRNQVIGQARSFPKTFTTDTTLGFNGINATFIHPTTDNNARAIIAPWSEDVPIPIGAEYHIVNLKNTVSIYPEYRGFFRDTIYHTSGSRGAVDTKGANFALAEGGHATLKKIGVRTWILYGTGIT